MPRWGCTKLFAQMATERGRVVVGGYTQDASTRERTRVPQRTSERDSDGERERERQGIRMRQWESQGKCVSERGSVLASEQARKSERDRHTDTGKRRHRHTRRDGERERERESERENERSHWLENHRVTRIYSIGTQIYI